MSELPIAVALLAGALATVNPCGFALLPVYATFLINGDEGTSSKRQALMRALAFTAAMSIGFAVVFGTFGLIVAPTAPAVANYLPWITIVLGILVVLGGLWLLSGRDLPSFVPKMQGTNVKRSAGSMTVFGMVFAIASLGCTIAPFLAIVVGTFRSASLFHGLLLFLTYAAGMALVVGVVSIAIALAREGIITKMKRALPWVMRGSGVLLLLAGAYVAYYGWWEIRVSSGTGDPTDPIISAAAYIQEALAGFIAWVFGR
ncbi:cytochrome c biogenesis CcdA family protein [Natronoglycomyces albus]|uniref:Cytochrome c biogenesis protein CcdA n=1 Tax=Natronoglycomyces albus TaxID=2811108 RepID=A0A895XIQ2_9ACTN|nr:cytochrome c biogenesis protein CcdA [Natronoglycomyces albus]QSB05214.1 cytochrome c biogenesis protein CcdA [Natronoglycomyces albus]